MQAFEKEWCFIFDSDFYENYDFFFDSYRLILNIKRKFYPLQKKSSIFENLI